MTTAEATGSSTTKWRAGGSVSTPACGIDASHTRERAREVRRIRQWFAAVGPIREDTDVSSRAARRLHELQARRDQAALLFREGFSQGEVARRLGVTTATTCRWHQAWRRRGAKGLRVSARLGRPPRLEGKEFAALHRALLEGAVAHGFSTELWTLSRVAALIRRRFGVRFHQGHVWKLVRRLGWSVQRPTTRARERDEEAIARWRSRTWPRLKKTAGPGTG